MFFHVCCYPPPAPLEWTGYDAFFCLKINYLSIF